MYLGNDTPNMDSVAFLAEATDETIPLKIKHPEH
jgi:hypothetical protein